jgi:signal transduction histidine kinase
MDIEKVHDRVFQLFKRFHKNVEGKGVGLYMVKTMIEELGGSIEVESKPNVGTTFKIFLKRIDTLLDNSDSFFLSEN